jgi:hypothetical protein
MKKCLKYGIFTSLIVIKEIMRVAMSHALVKRHSRWMLASKQGCLFWQAYGECRDNEEQAKRFRVCRHRGIEEPRYAQWFWGFSFIYNCIPI